MENDEYDIDKLLDILEVIKKNKQGDLNAKAFMCLVKEIMILQQDVNDLLKFIPQQYKKAFPKEGEPKVFKLDGKNIQESLVDIKAGDLTKFDIGDAAGNMYLNLLKHIEIEVKKELDDYILEKKKELNEKYYKKYGLEY